MIHLDLRGADVLLRLKEVQSSCDKFLYVANDLQAGLGATMKIISLSMLLAYNSRRVLLETPGNYCNTPPHTMQCVYLPWSPCDAPPNCSAKRVRAMHVRSSPFRCVEVSLKEFWKSRIWYGTGKYMYRTNISYALTKLLASPTAASAQCADDTIRRCLNNAQDYAFVHIRDSPEKRREQGKRLVTNTSAYIDAARSARLPIIWSTFSMKHVERVHAQFPDACFVNQEVGVHDADPSKVLFSNACSGHVARRSRAYIGSSWSMMSWLAVNSQHVQHVYNI
jgi:hypothetical protein